VKYVVIGAGAVGGTIGGLLFDTGYDVLLVARGAHLEALREHGLRLEQPERSSTLDVPVAGSVGAVDWQPGDVALLCTKSQDTAGVLAELPRDVVLVCAQNGVANERLAVEAGFSQVYGMCVVLPGDHLEPGVVIARGAPMPGVLDVGRYPSGTDETSVRIASDLVAAGFSARSEAAIMRWKYGKLLSNLVNAVDAAVGDDPDGKVLTDAARAEARRCFEAARIDVVSRDEERERRGNLADIALVGGKARQGHSTWQSLKRGTGSTEVAFLNGEIVRLGREHGIPTPVNELLQATVEEMAEAGEQPGSRRAAELVAAADLTD
jgi:2-dehydropantoate 2-reductase